MSARRSRAGAPALFGEGQIEWSTLAKHAGDVTGEPHGNPASWAWLANPHAESPPVVAIDVGRHSAVASVSPHAALVQAFPLSRIARDATREMRNALGLIRSRSGVFGLPLVIVEDVFIHEGARNPASSLTLARKVGAVCMAAAMAFPSSPIVRVLASTWQGAIHGKRLTREEGKKESVRVAARRFPQLAIGSDHEAEALLMAAWARGWGR